MASNLKESVSVYLIKIYESLNCADQSLETCNATNIEQVNCLREKGCKIENGEALMANVPKELWIAVQPFAINYTVSVDKLTKYQNYQKCASNCDEICVNSKDSSETCSQNCMLQFCYSYDYTSGGYYESQIAQKKNGEYLLRSSIGVYGYFIIPIIVGAIITKFKN